MSRDITATYGSSLARQKGSEGQNDPVVGVQDLLSVGEGPTFWSNDQLGGAFPPLGEEWIAGQQWIALEVDLGGQRLLAAQSHFYVDVTRPTFVGERQDGSKGPPTVRVGERLPVPLEVLVPRLEVGGIGVQVDTLAVDLPYLDRCTFDGIPVFEQEHAFDDQHLSPGRPGSTFHYGQVRIPVEWFVGWIERPLGLGGGDCQVRLGGRELSRSRSRSRSRVRRYGGGVERRGRRRAGRHQENKRETSQGLSHGLNGSSRPCGAGLLAAGSKPASRDEPPPPRDPRPNGARRRDDPAHNRV